MVGNPTVWVLDCIKASGQYGEQHGMNIKLMALLAFKPLVLADSA